MLPSSGAVSAPLPAPVPKRARPRQLQPQPQPQLQPQPQPQPQRVGAVSTEDHSAESMRPACECRWEGMLRGVVADRSALSPKRRKLSQKDPAEVRGAIWRHRGVLMPGIQQADEALEATATAGGHSAAVGSPRSSDPELLRGMLREMLLWCAPSATPAAVLRGIVVRRNPVDEAEAGVVDAEQPMAKLERGDFVTVSINSAQQLGWTAVLPLSFGRNERQQLQQWSQRSGQQGTQSVGWIRKPVRVSQAALRGCAAAPRTLTALAAAAAAASAQPTAGATGQAAVNGDGARACELLHGYLRGLALADGLHKGAQEMLLVVCDILRGEATAQAQTQKLKNAGADIPVPKEEMAAAFRWVYSNGMTASAGMVEYQGQRYMPKGKLITAMTPHPELHAKYVIRHAQKRQYLSSWAKANVEHCMRVELYPWLTQTFEKANGTNPWLRLIAEDDPLVELLNQSLSQDTAGSSSSRRSGVKNKWWYCILQGPGATGPLTVTAEVSGASATGGNVLAGAATATSSAAVVGHEETAAVTLPVMDSSMLSSPPQLFCKQPTHVASANGGGDSGGGDMGGLPQQPTAVGASAAAGPQPPTVEPSPEVLRNAMAIAQAGQLRSDETGSDTTQEAAGGTTTQNVLLPTGGGGEGTTLIFT
jgi:hypothetical protein